MRAQLSFDKFDQYFHSILKDNIVAVQDSEMTFSSLSYLKGINEHGEPTMSELAVVMQVKKPSVSTMVKKLESNGLVHVFRSEEDKRVCRVKLSEEGLNHIKISKSVDNIVFNRIEEILETSEFDEFSRLWEKISSNLCGD